MKINFNPINTQTQFVKAASNWQLERDNCGQRQNQLLDFRITNLVLETRVLGEKWIWATLIIRKVGDNKPWFSVKEDVVAIDLQQLIQTIALTHQFKSSKHLSFVRHTFGLCTILDTHRPAMLSLADAAFCCILRRFAVISPQRGTDVPDNSFIPWLFSCRHTHSE